MAGAALATHFFAWIAAVQLSTVANAAVFFSVNPVIIALAGYFIFGERVVFGASSGEVTILNTTSGELVWQFPTGSSIIASPAIVPGRLVIGTEDGQMYAFGASQ